ncbi:MAG: ATPase [Bacteroidales bacterium]|nr:ATPase [Bacteroidales bacterium]MCF8406118.1 ATPase [Bacteroidales bacterium]
MKLIADSGSTKTEWRLIDEDFSKAFKGQGINPLFLDEASIIHEINTLGLNEYFDEIKEVHFYAAGLALDELKKAFFELFSKIFRSHTKIFINDDLLAASRSLFMNGSGIACILGTGSNSCLFIEGKIKDKIPALGYILGDEGSGADMGKRLVNSLLKKDFESGFRTDLSSRYPLSINDVILNVYKKPLPNKYLASLSKIIKENIESDEMRELVMLSFNSFLTKNLIKYKDYQSYPIGFVGSIAYHFRDILESVMNEAGLKTVKIIEQPIEELAQYHKRY